jgi:hypothetical protein
MKKAKHSCFHCGSLSESAVQRIKPPTMRRFICNQAACWKAWYKLADSK